MTIKRAFRAILAPYILPELTSEFLLTQQGLDANEEYNNDFEKQLYSAAVEALYQVKTLEKEKDAGSENNYDTDKIDELILRYKRKAGFPEEELEEIYFIDRTDEY
jgi:hypothetical protein